MRTYGHNIVVNTASPVEVIDITDQVRKACAESGVRDGLATIFTNHTTSAIRINERCDRLQEDMVRFLTGVVPEGDYRHDEHTVDDRPNGRSHLMAMLLGASETIPMDDGELALGKWQSIFIVELDGPRNGRQVTVKVIGE